MAMTSPMVHVQEGGDGRDASHEGHSICLYAHTWAHSWYFTGVGGETCILMGVCTIAVTAEIVVAWFQE